MPATAGRVRMPANNRVHSSAALQTHGIWQSAIGYDPYAPSNKDDPKSNSAPQKSASAEQESDNAYANFQGLLALARITGSNADEARGACKKCGRVGHLGFQCRNFLSIKDDIKEREKDQTDGAQGVVLSGLEKIKGNGKIGRKEESEEEEEESESSDSEVDSEIERIIAERHGKKSSRGRSSMKRAESDGSESDDGERKKRGRSKKRRSKKRDSSDSEDEDETRRKKRRKERRKRDESSDEEEKDRRRRKRKSRKEKRRRRSHRYSDDSDSDSSEDSGRRRRHKSRKATSRSDSEVSASDDSRVGRGTKRSDTRSKKRHHAVNE